MTKEEIRKLAYEDVARNYTPLFNHDLTGDNLEFYREARHKAEIEKAAGAGADHAAYGWARQHYACSECQEAYDKGYYQYVTV